MPENDIEIRNTETYADHYLQEMIGAPPGWIVRSGISIIALFAITMLALAWLIRYPDKLTAPTILTSQNPPVEIVAGVNGFLDSLWVSNGQVVTSNSILATISDAAFYTDVARLKNWLDQCDLDHEIVVANPPQNLQLGTLANGYAALLQSLSDFQYFLEQRSMQQQIAAIQREITNTEQLNASLQRQANLLGAEIQIVHKDLDRNRQPRKDGVISAIDLEEKEKALIQYQRQLENLPASMLQNKIRIEQLTAQQLQLRQQWTDDKTARMHALRQQIQALQGAITTWEQQFVLRAPAAGQVAFAPELAAKNPVQIGSVLFTILPETNPGKTLARCQLATNGIGKINKGTPLQIALDAYPGQEYGVLNTEVADIALIPVTDKEGQFYYEVTALLPDTLTTSYGKTIPLRQRMSGIATLITEDKSILERIFENFLDIVKNR